MEDNRFMKPSSSMGIVVCTGGEAAKAQAFQAFWEAGAPLVGNEGGQGWAAWESGCTFTPGKTAGLTPHSSGTTGERIGSSMRLTLMLSVTVAKKMAD